jgi:hypothetical protein
MRLRRQESSEDAYLIVAKLLLKVIFLQETEELDYVGVL